MLVGIALRLVVAPVFWVWRWTKFSAGMGVMRGHLALLSPSERRAVLLFLPLTLPLFTLYRACCFLARVYRREFAQYALERFAILVGRHYGKGGLCYSDIQDVPDDVLARRWAELGSIRVGPFIDRYPRALAYRDGDSFLDAGCGMGNVIKELSGRYPTSAIHGFDLNQDAIRMVRCGTAGRPSITVEVGSLTDPAQLAKFADGAFDHAILCNVFHYIVAGGIAESAKLRQRIVDELVRITRRSVLLMLDQVDRSPETRVEIVSANACFIRDDIPGFFARHPGECLVISPDRDNVAVLYRHGGIGEGVSNV
ncbi:MAG TPA: class I SAM-dependent methyltransferase [Magnetospirillum sp.]|jgi:SAM-dependent methyltransferase|nr:class I SAM-dependent methyltransferase [Magnetospirillum sp.]